MDASDAGRLTKGRDASGRSIVLPARVCESLDLAPSLPLSPKTRTILDPRPLLLARTLASRRLALRLWMIVALLRIYAGSRFAASAGTCEQSARRQLLTRRVLSLFALYVSLSAAC
jgi:hypothetical protein